MIDLRPFFDWLLTGYREMFRYVPWHTAILVWACMGWGLVTGWLARHSWPWLARVLRRRSTDSRLAWLDRMTLSE
jgi:hypothetical protein